MKKLKVLFLLLLGSLVACQSTDDILTRQFEQYREKTYLPVMKKFTVEDVRYSGFHELFEYKATLHNSAVQKVHRELKAKYNQWSDLEIEKARQDAAKATDTKMFLSFYSPNRKVAELNKNGSSWTIILQNNGKRYVGEIEKSRVPRAEIRKFYPYHTRWSFAYNISFKVPVTALENSPSQLIISSSVGSSEKVFPALN